MTKQPTQAWQECPRASFCSINKCILHPDYEKLENDSSDWSTKNQKCIPKSIRIRIAEKYNLPHKGLTSREIQARERWESLPEAEKQAKIKKMQEISLITRLSKKGYAITPKKKINSETHIQNDQIALNGGSDSPSGLGVEAVETGEDQKCQ